MGAFSIQCTKVGAKVYALYVPGRYVGEGVTRKTIYRVDKQEPVSQEWILHGDSASNVNLPFEKVKSLIDALVNGNKLIIEVDDSQHEPVRHTFSLHGAGIAIRRVLKGCK